jgi:hypothetical protein
LVDGVVAHRAESAVERRRVVRVEVGVGAVADDEAVPEVVRSDIREDDLPEVACARDARLVAAHVLRCELCVDEALLACVHVEQTERNRGHVVVERPQAEAHRRPRGNGAARSAVEQVA